MLKRIAAAMLALTVFSQQAQAQWPFYTVRVRYVQQPQYVYYPTTVQTSSDTLAYLLLLNYLSQRQTVVMSDPCQPIIIECASPATPAPIPTPDPGTDSDVH